jgi:MFS family permease
LLNYLFRKVTAFRSIILGTVVTSSAWLIMAIHPAIWTAFLAIFVLALGEIIHQPRYYEYISRLAPHGQQGTYLGFAFLPLGIGSLIGGWLGGRVMHHYGEVANQPARAWLVFTAIGFFTALLLWIYDRVIKPNEEVPAP